MAPNGRAGVAAWTRTAPLGPPPGRRAWRRWRARRRWGPLGPYTLQAAIAACHARANTRGDRLAADRGAVRRLERWRRARWWSSTKRSRSGWRSAPRRDSGQWIQLLLEKALGGVSSPPRRAGQPLLAKLGRHTEAKVEFTRAAGLTENQRERTLLLARAAGLPPQTVEELVDRHA